MRYLLVLQFSEDVLSYDRLVELEDLLVAALGNQSEVDGHDKGGGESNIFILTDKPMDTFEKVKRIIEGVVSHEYRVAYREMRGQTYTILYPPNLNKFKVS